MTSWSCALRERRWGRGAGGYPARQRVSLGLQDSGQSGAQPPKAAAAGARARSRSSRQRAGCGPGSRRGARRFGHDVGGRHQSPETLSQLRQDGSKQGRPRWKRSVLLKMTIDRFPWRTRAASGSVLGADQVVVEHEDQEVGACRQVARFALALRAGRSELRQAWRVGQEDRPVDALHRIRVVPPPRASMPLIESVLRGFTPEQCIDQGGLARRARSKDGDHVELACRRCSARRSLNSWFNPILARRSPRLGG